MGHPCRRFLAAAVAAATLFALTSPADAGGLQLEDKPPVVTVTSPANGTLGQPDVRVIAQCVDDRPGCVLRVSVNAKDLAWGVGAIDTVIRPPDGQVQLYFRAIDSAGHNGVASRDIYVNSSPKLTLAETLPGDIIDIDADRALVFDRPTNTLRILDRATNSSRIIWTGWIFRAFLSPGGAIFTTVQPWGANEQLHEWRNGALVDLGEVASAQLHQSLIVKGRWALFVATNFPLPDRVLTLRDLTTGVNTVVSTTTAITYSWYYALSPDGRVFYTARGNSPTPLQIWEFAPGPPSTHTQVTLPPLRTLSPAADGTNLVFLRLLAENGPTATVLRTNAGAEVVLATNPGVFTGHYAVAGGWTAFARPDASGRRQIWTRAPDGTERQVSSGGGTPTIWTLNEQGDVIYTVIYWNVYQLMLLVRPDGTTLDLTATRVGSPDWIDGRWYVTSGPHLFAVGNPPARSILAEGATGTFFTTDVAILNPHQRDVPVTIRYLREHMPEIAETRTLAARSRTTIHLNAIAGLEGASVSTVVEATDGSPLVVERLMSWDETAYGGHLGSAIESPQRRWHFAEGAQGFFNTFFLLANSGASETSVRFTFLVEQGSPVQHTVTVAPGARYTLAAGDVPALRNRSFATLIESDEPIVAERAMYFGASPMWHGGHGSAGVTEPSHTWFHAEGATGAFFDTFILLANPHGTPVDVGITYFTEDKGEFTSSKTLPPYSRLTINVENEDPLLAAASFSTRVQSSGLPIVSERAMYWGGPGDWREAHNSFGVTSNGIKWGLAEGRAGGPRDYQTYLLVSNEEFDAAPLRVTFIREDGVSIERAYEVPKRQRLTINASAIPELANSNFGTIVDSLDGVTINVESAIYWNANGVTWEGGGNTTATRLP